MKDDPGAGEDLAEGDDAEDDEAEDKANRCFPFGLSLAVGLSVIIELSFC
jgi:hypothetical protein